MNLDKTLLNNIPGESENNSFRKTFAREEGRLIELIQEILEDIKIYFERFGCMVFAMALTGIVMSLNYKRMNLNETKTPL